ncbi:hypothetical protein PMAYCL1PPCAC_14527, partial [Pristionchus mayeri]
SQLREANARAERAEELLDSKQGVRDELKEKELEGKVTDLSNKLEEERERADEKITDLSEELKKEKRRSAKRIAELTNELEEERDGRS